MLYSDLDLISIVLATALPQGFPVLAPAHHSSSTEPEGAWRGSLWTSTQCCANTLLTRLKKDVLALHTSTPSRWLASSAMLSWAVLQLTHGHRVSRSTSALAKRRDHYPDEKKRVPAYCWLMKPVFKQLFQDLKFKWIVMCSVDLPKVTSLLTTQSIFPALYEER